MFRVGVTGLMASGKSDVAARFRDRGARLLEGDAMGWEVLRIPGVRTRIVERFGPSVLDSRGEVDRGALGRIVFADPGAMDRLNALVQPELKRRVREALAAEGPGVLVLDAALVSTWGIEPLLDMVVEVFATEDLRARRLRAKGLPDAEAAARIKGQTLPAVRGARRYRRIDNTGTKVELLARADEIWREIERFRSEVPSG